MMVSSDDQFDDIHPEDDFRATKGVVRGKYAERYHEKPRLIRLEADIAAAFADEAAVNAALRDYLTRGLGSNPTNPA